MPLPASGALSLNDIQTEFGGTNPISLNEYYAGGGIVPSGTTGTNGAVPSSGAISVFNFFGTSKALLLSYAWGSGALGRLGDGTAVNKSSPVSVVGGFTDWKQIGAGGQHTAGVRNNGSAWCWALNSAGQLGDGTTVNKSSPVSVVGGFTDWTQISAGYNSTFGVRTNGTAWAWGLNANGRLGDGTTVNKSSPVSVVGGFTDWKEIAGGKALSDGHTAGVRTNGTAYCWGRGTYGALGTGNTTDRSSPTLVVGGFTDWTQISAGSNHTAAVRTNGTAWCWGSNSNGTLGDNTTTIRSSPVSVVGGFTDWKQISAAIQHTAAVRNNGTAWCWGYASSGKLGDNTASGLKASPVLVVGGFTDWKQISAGGTATLAVRNNGTAWAWGGQNPYGRLGDNSNAARSSPVSVVGGFTNWTQISAGSRHTAAIRG